jgi:hypothetical protein
LEIWRAAARGLEILVGPGAVGGSSWGAGEELGFLEPLDRVGLDGRDGFCRIATDRDPSASATVRVRVRLCECLL